MSRNPKKIDNVKSLWKQIDYKTGFIQEAAKHFDRTENTLHNHWFARFFNVPLDEQDKCIEFMQNYIRLQNEKKIKA